MTRVSKNMPVADLIVKCDFYLSVTTKKSDYWTDTQTDARQSDPYQSIRR